MAVLSQRRRTGIEPACQLVAGTPVLKFVVVRAAWCRPVPHTAAEVRVFGSFVPSRAVWCRRVARSSFALRFAARQA